MIQRVVDGDTVRLEADGSEFVVRRLRPGVLLLTARGSDHGQFGESVLDEMRAEMARRGRITVFVDTREVGAVAPVASDAWAAFLRQERERLGRMHVLATSRFTHLTVEVAKHLSGTGELLRVTQDPADFEAAIRRSVPEFETTG